MKKILLACASGIATSTAVSHKLSSVLDACGYKDEYEITQCSIQEVCGLSPDYDFCVTTVNIAEGMQCPAILGVSLLTGIGMEKTVDRILEEMEK